MSEREQIEAWLTSVENRRFGYNGADKTVAGPMRRSLASLDAANARADEAEREVARLRSELDAAQLRSIEARNPGIDMDEVRRVRRAALTPEDTK